MSLKEFTGNLRKNNALIRAFAIIMVCLTHGHFETNVSMFNHIAHIGDMGVDFFMLLTGYGLYKSLEKNDDLKLYYKKRFIRIIPEYWFILLINHGIILFVLKQGYLKLMIKNIIKDVLMFYYLKGQFFNWYIPAIFMVYLVTPFIFRFLKKNKRNGFIICYALSVVFYLLEMDRLMVRLAARSFIYLTGMLLAQLDNTETDFELKPLYAFIVAAVCLTLQYHFNIYDKGFNYFIYSLSVPAVLFIIFFIANRVKDKNLVKKLFSTIGKYSYEIYLWNIVAAFQLLHVLGGKYGMGYDADVRFILIGISIVMGIIMGYLYSKLLKSRFIRKYYYGYMD